MRAEFRLRYLIVCIVMLLSVLNVAVFAESGVEVDVSYVLSDVVFDAYKVGEVNSKGYQLSGEFADYRVDMTDSSAAQTLVSYIKRDGIVPTEDATTGSDKKARFKGMRSGVYLITGEEATRDGVIYTALPSLVAVDGQQEVVAVNSKHESRVIDYNEPGKESSTETTTATEATETTTAANTSTSGSGAGVTSKKISISAQKVWSGDKRESEVVVQLLKDGEVYGEAKLNSGNNWRCTWDNLSSKADWSVVEKDVPSGYVVSVDRDGNAFVITNKAELTTVAAERTTEETTVETITVVNEKMDESSDNDIGGNKSNEPAVENEQGDDGGSADGSADGMRTGKNVTPNGSDTYSEKRGKDGSDTDTDTTDGKLPQTGQLWWPVGMCAGGGTFMMLLGAAMIRKKDE